MTDEIPKLLQEPRKRFGEFRGQLLDAVRGPDAEYVRRVAATIEPKAMAPLPEPWRLPNAEMLHIAAAEYQRAKESVATGATVLRIGSVYTGFEQYPEASFDFDLDQGERVIDFAPLVSLCLDDVIYDGLVEVVITAHSPLARNRRGRAPRDLYPGDDALALQQRANKFLQTEATLWGIARHDGGFNGEVPYTTRYEAARYLWSPGIRGTAFCLRCGETIIYQRAGRGGKSSPRRVPICDACHRSGSFDWPAHAIMPAGRGTWWLRCATKNCSKVFVGPKQAKHCPGHRLAGITPGKRHV